MKCEKPKKDEKDFEYSQPNWMYKDFSQYPWADLLCIIPTIKIFVTFTIIQ